MKLTDINIKKVKPGDKVRKLSDGGGLFLQIELTGGKLWRYKYRFAGKQKLLALGKYPDVPLQEARKRHQEARGQLAQGIDPAAAKKAVKTAKGELAANSFEVVAREWVETWKKDKTADHSKRTMTRLEKDVFPWMGRRPVAEIKAPEVLDICRRIEKRGAIETAHRVKVVISQVMRYAIATGRADRDPCPDLRGALQPVQPQPHPSLTEPAEVAELLRAIENYKGTQIVRSALALAPLVFVRPGELRAAKWEDIDLENAEWVFAYLKQRANIKVKRKADIIHSARLRNNAEQPGGNTGIISKYQWFDNDNDDIGRQDIIYSTLPDWSKTKVRHDHLITWLKDIEYNDMFFNPKTGIGADNRAFMNPEHLRYNPLLAAAVTAWEAFETKEVQNEYRNKNSRIAIEAWLGKNAENIPKLFQKIGVVSKISKNAAEKISEVANWNKIGAQKKNNEK